MPKLIDLTGKKFNRLLVKTRAPNNNGNRPCWNCICDCGNKTIVSSAHLKNGHVKSCGCLKKDTPTHTTHGMTGCAEHVVWNGMKNRCYTPSNIGYPSYGGRGIAVCDRWRNSFENFFSDMGPRPTKYHTIERINNDIGYSPENCKWATRTEQNNNARRCINITYKGETMTLAQWCRQLGLKYEVVRERIQDHGWSTEEALTTPIGNARASRLMTYNGETRTLVQWAKHLGINYPTLHNRLSRLGWTPERAFTTTVMNKFRHHKP